MHREQVGAALNLALGDKLTLVNKGFVQALCLRFHGSRQSAELAYADNLAATRRLMQLIREMQRLGVPLDPDGAPGSPDRSEPDLQGAQRTVWLSDLRLATRILASLRRGQKALASSPSGGEESPGLDLLIEEGVAFVAELHNRAKRNDSFDQPELTQAASDAEKKSLENFLCSLKDTDKKLLAGEVESTRPADDSLFAVLNTVLGNHFLAIEQFFLNGFLLEQCNEKALGEVRIKHSLDEMTGAFRVAQRILLLGSVPRSVFLQEIRSLHPVKVGSDPVEAIRHDLALTESLIANLQRASEMAEVASEARSVEMLSLFIDTERNAREWLSDQLDKLSQGGQPAEASGEFDTMLNRWAVT